MFECDNSIFDTIIFIIFIFIFIFDDGSVFERLNKYLRILIILLRGLLYTRTYISEVFIYNRVLRVAFFNGSIDRLYSKFPPF